MQQQRRRPPVALSPVALNNNSNRPIRQSTRSMPPSVSPCFGCSQPMYTQFISDVLDHSWHPECVRCFVCRCLLNEQCYSREGKLYCKDDFIKKYIHRCFACQNLVQSHELIRRIRAGRIYHAECFVCTKCKRTLQDDDISSLLKSDGATFNDLDCICQTCLNPTKSSDETPSLSNENEHKTEANKTSTIINGKTSPSMDTQEEKPSINDTSIVDNHVNGQQSMEVDEPHLAVEPSKSPVKEHSSPSSPPVTTPPTKTTGRQSKVRQSTSSNGSKRSPAKSKTTAVSRQKQTTANEKKGRSPATRSRSSAGTSATPPVVQRRSSNRRTAKTTRYRKRSFSSGSDEEETDDEDDDDTDFTEEDNMPDHEQEMIRSPAVKTNPSANSNEKKTEPEPAPPVVTQLPLPPLPPPPPQTTINPSLLSQAKMSEPLSLLSGLAANPMSISSIMKPDITASFMPPNFNPAFPTPSQFLPPGYPLQPRLPMPPPPSALTTSQSQSAPIPDSNRSSHSANASDTDSLDHSSSPSQMDISTNVEPGTPARPITPPKSSRPTSSSSKPSALSSLLEFGTLPPSTLGDIRPNNTSTNPFPFPFVTPGPGVPFSPQAAAGMATFYRPPFGISPSAMPLDMTQSNSNSSKKKADTTDNEEIISQNLLDDSSTSSASPKKKARKSNSRSKSKTKKNEVDSENAIDEDNPSPPLPPPPPSTANKKKKKLKTNTTENGNTNDSDETKFTNGNTNNHSHNLLAQMGLMNNSFMPPPLPPPSSSSSTNGKTPTPNPQHAQLAAMYNMAPHFAAYNAFQGAFNPAFAAAYAGGYPAPYGFHPAFGAPTPGQPFPFMPPTSSSTGAPLNNTLTTDDKASSIVVPETRPAKSRSKSNTGGEKKKTTTPRSNKKKSIVPPTSIDLPVSTEGEPVASFPSIELIPQVATTPESTSTPTKRHMSSTESEDFDEQQHSQTTNGKSGNESDGSLGDGDRSLNTVPSISSSTAPEKKGARTTIKPQQLDVLCKAYDTNSKPNKPQREQLVAETGLSLRVIQVWFQNKRSKERKGKPSKDKDTPLDDDDAGDDSQPSPPPTTSESVSVNDPET